MPSETIMTTGYVKSCYHRNEQQQGLSHNTEQCYVTAPHKSRVP